MITVNMTQMCFDKWFQPMVNMMLITWSPCTGARSNLRDRIWGEVEEDSFISLLVIRGHTVILPSNTVTQPGSIW